MRITDGAIVAAATLSNRYIADRFLPDKAIDLIDEAAARKRMAIDSKPEAIDELDRRIMQLRIEEGALKKETDQASKDRLRAAAQGAGRARAALGRADRAVAGREGQARLGDRAQGGARAAAPRAGARRSGAATSSRPGRIAYGELPAGAEGAGGGRGRSRRSAWSTRTSPTRTSPRSWRAGPASRSTG